MFPEPKCHRKRGIGCMLLQSRLVSMELGLPTCRFHSTRSLCVCLNSRSSLPSEPKGANPFQGRGRAFSACQADLEHQYGASLLTDHLFSLWYGLIQASIHLSEQGSLSKWRAFARPRAHRSSQVLVLVIKTFFLSKKVGYLLAWVAVPSKVVLFSVLLIQVCRQ